VFEDVVGCLTHDAHHDVTEMTRSTKMFLHGVLENSAVWDALVHELHSQGVANSVRLAPSGFRAPTPACWGATVVEYRDWLLGDHAPIGGPIDVVTHD